MYLFLYVILCLFVASLTYKLGINIYLIFAKGVVNPLLYNNNLTTYHQMSSSQRDTKT